MIKTCFSMASILWLWCSTVGPPHLTTTSCCNNAHSPLDLEHFRTLSRKNYEQTYDLSWPHFSMKTTLKVSQTIQKIITTYFLHLLTNFTWFNQQDIPWMMGFITFQFSSWAAISLWLLDTWRSKQPEDPLNLLARLRLRWKIMSFREAYGWLGEVWMIFCGGNDIRTSLRYWNGAIWGNFLEDWNIFNCRTASLTRFQWLRGGNPRKRGRWWDLSSFQWLESTLWWLDDVPCHSIIFALFHPSSYIYMYMPLPPHSH